jgi:hypothetical protein
MTAAPDIPNTRVAYVVPDLKVDCLLLPVADAAHCTHLATMGQNGHPGPCVVQSTRLHEQWSLGGGRPTSQEGAWGAI